MDRDDKSWRELSSHLATVLHAATVVIRRARIHAISADPRAGLRGLMKEQAFAELVARVSEANNWAKEQARQLGPVRLSGTPADHLGEMFPDLRSPEPPAAPVVNGAAGVGERRG